MNFLLQCFLYSIITLSLFADVIDDIKNFNPLKTGDLISLPSVDFNATLDILSTASLPEAKTSKIGSLIDFDPIPTVMKEDLPSIIAIPLSGGEGVKVQFITDSFGDIPKLIEPKAIPQDIPFPTVPKIKIID